MVTWMVGTPLVLYTLGVMAALVGPGAWTLLCIGELFYLGDLTELNMSGRS